MKKDQKQPHDENRRNFLRGSVATGMGLTMAAGMPGLVVAADDSQTEKDVDQGYQLTGHVLEYYKTLTN